MKKGKTHYIRLLFSAAVSAILFYLIARGVFLYFWRFDISSARHWIHIWNKWQSGWVFHKPKEVMFFIAVLGLLPAYFATWFIVHSSGGLFRLPLVYLQNRKKAKMQAKSLAAALGPADKKVAAPKKEQPKMHVSAQKMQHIDQLRGKKTNVQRAITEHHHAPADSGAVATDNSASRRPAPATNSKEEEAAARFDLWEKLAQQLEKEHIFILRQMKVGSFPVNTFAVTQEGVFLLCEGPTEGREWTIDESANPPVWHTEKGDIPSPLRPLIDAKAKLHEYIEAHMPQYAGLSVNCCMILDHANVANPDDLMDALAEWDISVLRMGSCRTQSLPDTGALLEYIKSQPASDQKLNDAVAVAILDLMASDQE